MASKNLIDSNEKKQVVPEDWLPVSVSVKTKSPKLVDKGIDQAIKEFMDGDLPNMQSKINVDTVDSIETNQTNVTSGLKETEQTKSGEQIVLTASKRISSKQRKESLEEYREAFLQVPTIENRKPVFLSCELRDKLDDLVRKLGSRKMSVSGFIENFVRHHFEIYQDDVDMWKKL
ncbi:MAG: DUF3408 domain-containing protein [Tannerella sp.]|jgi:5'-3' exonuclease|nr:DUF3408 domain-containing protein [Tannerella sp.]